MSFKYNSSGLRTEKTVNGETKQYFYSGDLLVSEYDGVEYMNFTYSPSGEPVGFSFLYAEDNEPLDYYIYLKNLQGDIIGLIDFNGAIYCTYSYDAWGKLTGVYDKNGNEITNPNSAALRNPLRYRGYYYDNETGLYYLKSRYYNPEWGRFVSADGYVSTGQGLLGTNMYAYCLNNPVNYADPSGLVCVCMTRRVGGNNHVCRDIKIVQHGELENTVIDEILSMPQFAKYSKSTNNSSGFSKSSVGSSFSGGAVVKSFADGFFSYYASSYADQYIHSFLPAPPKSSIGSGSQLISSLDDFSKSVGFFSVLATSIGIVWDAEQYQDDPFKQGASIVIDLVGVATNIAVNAVIVFPSGGTGIVLSAATSATISLCFGLLKEELLG